MLLRTTSEHQRSDLSQSSIAIDSLNRREKVCADFPTSIRIRPSHITSMSASKKTDLPVVFQFSDLFPVDVLFWRSWAAAVGWRGNCRWTEPDLLFVAEMRPGWQPGQLHCSQRWPDMHSDSRVLDNFFFSISVKFLISRVFDLSETAHFVCMPNEKFNLTR